MMWMASGDTCSNMPHSLRKHGAAFACGFIRIASVALTAMVSVVFGYACYTVYSYCEDLKAGGSGKGLDQLMQYQEEQKMRTAYDTFAVSVNDTVGAIRDKVA